MLSEAQISLFVNHVSRFLKEHYSQHSRNVVVAVSGGVDSMLLLHLANELLKRDQLDTLRAITVNHGTRAAQERETKAVQFEAQKLELSCDIINLNLGEVDSNIEDVLRTERHEKLKAALEDGEELWMGHHLDDSWEWSQMQGARSSEVRSTLGIPFKAGPIVRPFMCVSKRQIVNCAQTIRISWLEDPTNKDPRFERNWVRRKMAPLIDARHPQFLKHYARRSQNTAEMLGLTLKPKKKSKFTPAPTRPSSKVGPVSSNSHN